MYRYRLISTIYTFHDDALSLKGKTYNLFDNKMLTIVSDREIIGIPSSFESIHGAISVGGSAEKDLALFCFGSGSLTLYANVSKKGYLPGEVVEVHCSVDNDSSVDVTPRLTLYQTQIYMCGERHKSLEVALTEYMVGNKVTSETKSMESLFVTIPKNATLTIKSAIITIKYFIHITLDIPHAIDLHINLPIIVTNRSALGSN
ncbi:unnamed protein product [Oppiella nova]|uniref:Arrestin C-terminal-like domain-containing protein n=1 Tax=Oppiella nova TaxID=334625 RepID=A0A7R9MCF6_9ACAR|nr:unnamed protein product [Oppiella nova]CAG2173755.1 unnamed protein product [Oppiella nova]